MRSRGSETPQVSISVEQTGGLRMVRVRGQIDIASTVELHAALDDARADPLDLLVDLFEVDFLDCAGVRPLAAAAVTQAKAGRQFAIVCSPRGSPARLFKALVVLGVELPVLHSRADGLLAALATPSSRLPDAVMHCRSARP
jgi:anti-sigma B factor antagonist